LRAAPRATKVAVVAQRLLVGLVSVSIGLTGCGSDERVSIFSDDPQISLHVSQPMVADLHISLERPARVQVGVDADPGVRAEVPGEPRRDVRVRLRGLAPATHYEVKVLARSGDGEAETRVVPVDTLAALSGFEPSFEVTGRATATGILFDYTATPEFTRSAIVAVDGEGTTRFFLPTPVTAVGFDVVPRVPAGIKLLDDGRIVFTKDHHLRVMNELGDVELDVRARDVGIDGFHHDVCSMPNGNFLVMGYEFGNVVYPDETRYIAGDVIAEITPDGEKIWQWSSLEHLDPQRVAPDFYSPFKVLDPTTGALAFDWTHGNAVVYLPEDDALLVSLRHQDWVLKIDHATGEVLWRLGNEGDFQLKSGRWFFHQHSPELEPDGSILLYDNGNGNPDVADEDEHSRAVRYALDEQAHTAEQIWESGGDAYMSPVAGDADLIDGDHVLVLDSSLPVGQGGFDVYGRIRELDPASASPVFSLRTPDHRFVFRAVPVSRWPGEAR